LILANHCLDFKSYHAAGATLFAAYLAKNPKADEAANDRRQQFARSALLAAAGKGRDVAAPTAEEKAKLRGLALTWLRAELQRWNGRWKNPDAKAVQALLLDLPTWPDNPALALTRDVKERSKWPADERRGWKEFWLELDQLLEQAALATVTRQFTGTLTAEQREHVHELKARSGQVFLIDLESTQFDAYLQVKDAKGQSLAEHDDVAPDNKNARLTFTAPEDGTYRVVATSFTRRGTGAFTLTVRSFAQAKE
jgi:hypothetical protein